MFPAPLIDEADRLVAAFRAWGMKVVTAESCTGGLLAAVLTEIAGSSEVLERGFVTYSNAAKEQELGVSGELLARHGAVSAEVAQEMAAGARKHLDCDVALSSTGIAGPDGGSAEKPVGLVFLGLATREGVRSSRHVLGGTRAEIVARSAAYALDLARRHLAASRA